MNGDATKLGASSLAKKGATLATILSSKVHIGKWFFQMQIWIYEAVWINDVNSIADQGVD